eukprot:TRINITY_DN3018_c0_g1::TRINITY_DN3018_c0_g1_i1::g.22298::m.22298 TRINITY_DN3018_c0_g1::TRINITY_DN3018_c0_g1_i1::g.22298  ORF type:complete len:129 (+),score=7.57,DUF2259/PF10016.4/0.091 TRINITY_DN3018_c0_g1_i1:906-1292(+)
MHQLELINIQGSRVLSLANKESHNSVAGANAGIAAQIGFVLQHVQQGSLLDHGMDARDPALSHSGRQTRMSSLCTLQVFHLIQARTPSQSKAHVLPLSNSIPQARHGPRDIILSNIVIQTHRHRGDPM